MKILVGPDSFKDSLSASEFCKVAKQTIQSYWPDDTVITIPLADGGEGTVDALVEGTSGEFIELPVIGPLGETIIGRYGMIQNGHTAVIEMAAASGLPLVPISKRNPMKTTTYGTGQLIMDAISKGAKKVIVGIGGSATNDAGLGMMQALGFKCLDSDGNDIPYGGEGLKKLASIAPPMDTSYESIDIQVACDVNNPLFGRNGAAYIYAKQKGADEVMIVELDNALKNFSTVVSNALGKSIDTLPGGGAAGGLGAGLYAALGARLMPGFEIIRETVGLDAMLKDDIDLVITAEGQMNHQSMNGKLPVELAKLAQKNGIRTIVLVGSRDIDISELDNTGIIGVFPIADGPMTLGESMANSKKLVKDSLIHILSLVHAYN